MKISPFVLIPCAVHREVMHERVETLADSVLSERKLKEKYNYGTNT